MKRIAIIGNAGGGKSLFANKLGGKLDVPVYHFDDLQWKPGWHKAEDNEILAVHDQWLSQPSWVIDGWGNWEIIKERFEAADTLIFIDLQLRVHYWWAVKRQGKAIIFRDMDWPPDGCPAWKVTGRLLKLIWTIHTEKRQILIEIIRGYSGGKRIIEIRSPQDFQSILDGA